MKNKIQSGGVLSLLAPYDVLSGGGFKVANIFAVASADALSGAAVEGETQGVFELAKTTGTAWTVGQRIYWDNSNKKCITTSAGNMLIGLATEAAGSSAAVGRVKLIGLDRILQATGTLDFASIATTASADLTIAVTGAEVGDAVALGLPAAPAAGLVFMAFVSAADTVTVRAMNITGSGVDAASASYRVAVIKQ